MVFQFEKESDLRAVAIASRKKPFEVIELSETSTRYKKLYQLKGEELEVEVKAVSINPVDWKIARFLKIALPPFSLPHIFGADFAGVVIRTGAQVRNFRAGDRVFGSAHPVQSRAGAFAEKVQLPQARVGHIPDGVSFSEAAALPIAGLTAYQAFRMAAVTEGAEVFINGGSGGVGRFAIQYAKTLGCHITATSSPRNFEALQSAGADVCIDYRGTAPSGPFQFIFDAAAKMPVRQIRQLLGPTGTYISTLPRLNLAPLRAESIFSRRTLRDMWVKVNTHDLEAFADLVAQKKIQVHAQTFTGLEGVLLALEASASGQATGKLVVEV